jgi:hypothetical protein
MAAEREKFFFKVCQVIDEIVRCFGDIKRKKMTELCLHYQIFIFYYPINDISTHMFFISYIILITILTELFVLLYFY